MRQLTALLISVFLASTLLSAQTGPDTLRLADLAPVTVTAYHLELTALETPLALTCIGEYRLQHGQQQLALDESLSAIPGVYIQNADNFAQDLRVSIRGFGARSAFGIRGVKIIVDGFPESTPDGQGQVDNIDPGSLTSVSVIRGASAGLYGNASGGVLNLSTLNFIGRNFMEIGTRLGSFDFQKYQARMTGGKLNKMRYNFSGAYTKTDGYREQSAMKNYLFNGGVFIRLDSSSHLIAVFNFVNSPLAEDAGGVTLEQATKSPKLPSNNNLLFGAGEKLWQGRLGLSYTRRMRHAQKLTARLYHTQRNFSSKLAFEKGGQVELQRSFSGGSINYSKEGRALGIPVESSSGVELQWQRDNRKRFDNLPGMRGPQSLGQVEQFSNFGAYIVQRWSLSKRLNINPGLRLDNVRLSATDHFLADGNDSGKRNFTSLNPIFGAVYALSESMRIYGNYSTSFETPVLSELSSNPLGGGFNPSLDPQKSQSLELGLKGLAAKGRFRYELAVFYIKLKDEFIPFELGNFPGRTFYRNAASSDRSGIEAGLGARLGRGFYTYLNYTYSYFTFANFQTAAGNFDGNLLPGIPKHLVYAELRYFKTKGIYGSLTTQYIGTQTVNDANDTFTAPYFLVNLKLGYVMKQDGWELEPSFGVNNIFNAQYFSNFRINAFGGRYYEPAPEIHFFGGLKIRINQRN